MPLVSQNIRLHITQLFVRFSRNRNKFLLYFRSLFGGESWYSGTEIRIYDVG